jgi:hypothetical protein
LFIDTFKRSLEAVLLHNSNNLTSIPIAHVIHLKETYEHLRTVLEKMKYHEHNCYLYGDMKILGMYWDNKDDAQSFHVSYANGIVEQGTNTGQQKTGLKGKI